jgi:Rrf2 family protein
MKMKISSRFSVAVHILSLLSVGKDNHNTSEWIADSVNTNPALIRKLIGMLKKAGFVNVRSGTGGAFLIKTLDEVTLLDVFRAVEVVEEGELFHFHDDPNPNCPVGSNIQSVLEWIMLRAQNEMEQVLAKVTMEELVTDLVQKIKVTAK